MVLRTLQFLIVSNIYFVSFVFLNQGSTSATTHLAVALSGCVVAGAPLCGFRKKRIDESEDLYNDVRFEPMQEIHDI